MGALPPVFIEFLGKATGFHATAAGVRRELAEVETQGGGQMARLGAVSKAALLGIGVAAGVAAVASVHMAADFQTQMTRVRTGAGELQQNMKMVSQGVLDMAGEVGQSTHELTSGLYTVESAGYHGAAALNVLKVSAEGAKVGAADMASVTDAVTTALNAYKMGADQATSVMNALVATEANGKTNMEALASSMSGILPVAAAAKVGLNEVLGAMATMTSEGTTAKVAATYLRQTIGQLSNPSAKAAGEMRDLGLDATQVSLSLGKNGLVATLKMLTDAIVAHMGPAGTVLIDKLKSLSGNTTEFQKVLANLPETQQSYIGALATMVGGTKSMMAGLQLTGPHLETFKKNVDSIGEHVKAGGKNVEGWSDVQKTFNQQMAEAKGSLQAMGIEIGTQLMPAAMGLIHVLGIGIGFLARNRVALELVGLSLFALTAGLTVAAIASWSFTDSILADPLTWIVVAIVAVVAALVLLVLHWKEVAHWLGTVWHDTVSGLVVAWHWLADNTTKIWNDDIVKPLETAWKAIVSATETGYHAVVDPVVSAWNAVVSATVTAWNAVVGAVVAGYHAVVDPLVTAWNAVVSVTTTVWNAIAGFFKTWWPLLFVIFLPGIAILVGAWRRFHQYVYAAARIAWESVLAFLRTTWGLIKSAASAVWLGIQIAIIAPTKAVIALIRSAWGMAASALSATWGVVEDAASAAWSGIKAVIIAPVLATVALIRSTWNAAMRWLGSMWSSIHGGASVGWQRVRSAIVTPIANALGAVRQYMVDVKNAIFQKMTDAYNSVLHFGDRFTDVGYWIVMGIVHGVENAAGFLKDEVKNLAHSALDAAKNVLDINSPSKVFAKVIGYAIPEGIAKGATDRAHIAHSAVRTLAGNLVGSASLTAGAFGPGRLSLATGSGTTVVHNHFHTEVHGSVIAERDLGNTVTSVMQRRGMRNTGTYQQFKI